ncbi:MAG: carboxyl-terminal processing protease [Thermomicrobiales bacterium]|jgi:C-terminal peptidase prc|nr:carboxyl-terminal processing protease [Thermomicrobiales bacterium]
MKTTPALTDWIEAAAEPSPCSMPTPLRLPAALAGRALPLKEPLTVASSVGRTNGASIDLGDQLAPPPFPSEDERVELLHQVWSTVDAYYLDRTFAGVDWRSLRNDFEARVRGAQTVEEFYALIVQMVARLGDQHTRYAPPWQVATEVALAGNGSYEGIGLITVVQIGDLLVGYVFAGSPAARAGITARDRITAVDDNPVGQFSLDYLAASPRFALDGRPFENLADPFGLSGPAGTTVRVTVVSPDGARRTLRLVRDEIETTISPEGFRLPDHPGIAYLRIPTLSRDDMAAQVESTLASLLAEGRLDGLILDLRLNVGGRNLGVQTILGHFVDGQVGYAEDTFEGRPRRNPIVVDTSPLGDQLRDVPLAVLVDPGTNSNAEVLAAVLQQQRAAFVVGTLPPATSRASTPTSWTTAASCGLPEPAPSSPAASTSKAPASSPTSPSTPTGPNTYLPTTHTYWRPSRP